MNESNVTQAYSYCKYSKPHSDAERTIQVTALAIVGGFGLLGNIFTIVLAAKYTVQRNLHFLIINLAVSDALSTVIIFLQGTSKELNYKLWDNDLAGCIASRITAFMHSVALFNSLFSLTIISVERYRITRRRVVQQSVYLAACCWLISMAMSSHLLFLVDYGKKCTSSSTLDFHIFLFSTVFLYCILFLTMLVINTITLRRLSHRQAIEDSISDEQRKLRRKRTSSAVRMVLYSLLLYSCCFSPLLIYGFIGFLRIVSSSVTNFTNTNCIDHASMNFVIGYFLPIVNSSVSPCVYFVCLSDFTEAAKSLLCRSNVVNNPGSIPTVDIRNGNQLVNTTSM